MQPPSSARRWVLPAGAAGQVTARRALATASTAVGVVLAIALAAAIGVLTGSARFAMLVGALVIAGTGWLASRMWTAPPREMSATTLTVPRPAVLVVGTRELAVRSCLYDPLLGLLWARGRLGVARACIEASREDACEIVDALGCTEHELRTVSALPWLLTIPWVGSPLAFVVACALAFGVTMLVAGPLAIGVPAAALTIPLAVLCFRPATLRLGDHALEWRWWARRRVIPLSSIERVVATSESLRVHMRDGAVAELHVRVMSGDGVVTRWLDERARTRLASFGAFVDRRAHRSVAATFE